MLKELTFLSVLLSLSSAEFSLDKLRNHVLNQSVTDECYTQYRDLGLKSFARMIDSSALLPKSLMTGNFYNLGNFDECLAIQNETTQIYGKYCLVAIKMDFISTISSNLQAKKSLLMVQDTRKKFENVVKSKALGSSTSSLVSQMTEYVKIGVCIPDKCTGKTIRKLLPISLPLTHCYTKSSNSEMGTGASIAMGIICFFLVIVVLSTVYDMVIEYSTKELTYPILISFSLLTNSRKLLKTSNNPDQLSCLNGIKTFSMMWVVLGHTYLNMSLSASIDNFLDINNWVDDPKNMLILSATVSVDTFFTIGGLLTVYVYMKAPDMDIIQSFKKIPLLYLHRYLRLTPAFAMMILIYGSGLLKYISDGPKWDLLDTSINNCQENWWAALLYIQNYMNYSKICVVQSWYLAAEFQLFMVTPFLLIPLKKWPKIVIPILYVLVGVGIIIPFCMGYTNKMSGIGMGSATTVFVDDYYFTTHTRFATYIIGMIAGYYIFVMKSRKNPLKLNTEIIIILWILSLGGLFLCIFDGYILIQNGENEWLDGLYMGLNRSTWSIAVSILIMLCSTGHGGAMNEFLSLPIFQFIAKLSYSMYLTHYIIIMMINLSSRSSVHFTNFFTITQFFIHFTITLIVSIFYCLIFESPVITIERIVLPYNKPKITDTMQHREKV